MGIKNEKFGSGASHHNSKFDVDESSLVVGVALGSVAAGVIQDLDPDGKIELKSYEEFRNIPQDVEMGRIDAYFGNTITMLGDIEKMDLDCKINPLVLHATEVAYPFRKDDEESAKIMKELNTVLKEMNEDGTIAELSKKWLKIDVTSFAIRFFECYAVVMIIYWVIVVILTYIQKILEEKMNKGY